MRATPQRLGAPRKRGLKLTGPVTADLLHGHYPDYDGPVEVYGLQSYIANRALAPLLERYTRPDAAVADFGCGSGTLLKSLEPRVASVIGVDLDDGAFWKYPDLDLRRGSLYQLPIDTASIDLATSKWVFEHLEHPARAVAEIARVLRPGGAAIIAAPNVLHPSMLLSHLTPTWMKKRALAAFDDIKEDLVMPTYYRANTQRALDRWFAGEGFDKLEFHYWGDPSYWLFSAPLFRAAERARAAGRRIGALRPFRMNLVGVYRKAPTA